MRWLDGITDSKDEFEQALGVGDGQGSLVCCSPWDHKVQFSSIIQLCPTLGDMTTGKIIALTRWTFVSKVITLLFNMLSTWVIAFFQGASIF